jgi:uncharacterized protein
MVALVTSADLLLHPVRLRIVQAFLGDRALTTSTLNAELADVPAASLYRHVARLVNAGVLAVVAERRVRGALERTYVLRVSAASIGLDEVAQMSADEHRQAFMAFIAGLLGDFDRYLARGDIDPLRDGASYRLAGLWLDDAELAELLREVQRVFQPRLANPPAPGRRRRILGTVLLPGEDAPSDRPAPASHAGRRPPPAGDSSPDPAKSELEELMKRSAPVLTGLRVIEMARAGQFAQIRDLFAPQLREMVPPEALGVAWAAAIGRRGQVISVGVPVCEPAGPGAEMMMVKIPVTFERGDMAVLVSVTADGSLVGIQLAPADAAKPTEPWAPPGYADPDSFDEQDVTLGSGTLAVPGTLSLPRRPGPLSAIVLLAGSGPGDRDETMGRNKPFKDFAWGLASLGVAVLRFDKVTFARADELGDVHDFTVADEYVPHAVAAIHLLREHPSVDSGRVFVLGHSLGGTVAPRVAAAEPSVAGLVIAAGGTEPLHWAAVRQVRYLASLDPQAASAAQPAIEAMSRQAAMADSPDLSPSTPASELPFGVPAPYWLDLREYDPVVVAASLDKPILIVQGGRDYQSTVADDLAGWQAGLAGRPDVTIRVYDADNHLFFPGSGPSSPAEYEPAQHVDQAVVADIAGWLMQGQ